MRLGGAHARRTIIQQRLAISEASQAGLAQRPVDRLACGLGFDELEINRLTDTKQARVRHFKIAVTGPLKSVAAMIHATSVPACLAPDAAFLRLARRERRRPQARRLPLRLCASAAARRTDDRVRAGKPQAEERVLRHPWVFHGSALSVSIVVNSGASCCRPRLSGASSQAPACAASASCPARPDQRRTFAASETDPILPLQCDGEPSRSSP